MSGFSIEWLTRREPYDRRARNTAVLAAVARSVAAYPSARVVDIACGTGATLRAMSGVLPQRQSWLLVDNDLSLLARAQPAPNADVTVRTTPLDLVHDLETALDGPVDLVTASAFLDLVSAEWIERLVTEIAVRKLRFYAALTYDGRVGSNRPIPRTRRSSPRSIAINARTRALGRRSARRRRRPRSGCLNGSATPSNRARRTRSWGRPTICRWRSWQVSPPRQRKSAALRSAPSTAGRRAARACSRRTAPTSGSATSISSPTPPGDAERTGHSRRGPRRPADTTAPAAEWRDRRARGGQACNSPAPTRG